MGGRVGGKEVGEWGGWRWGVRCGNVCVTEHQYLLPSSVLMPLRLLLLLRLLLCRCAGARAAAAAAGGAGGQRARRAPGAEADGRHGSGAG